MDRILNALADITLLGMIFLLLVAMTVQLMEDGLLQLNSPLLIAGFAVVAILLLAIVDRKEWPIIVLALAINALILIIAWIIVTHK